MKPALGWFRECLLRSAFLDRLPMYAYALAGLEPYDDPAVPVMAVSRMNDRFRLHINTGFFKDQEQFFPGVLQHELHHIVLGHVTNLGFKSVEQGDLMQIAQEISANEYITEPLPGEPLRWQGFTEHGLHPGQSTMLRYELLCAAARDGRLGQRISVGVRCCEGKGIGEITKGSRHLIQLMREMGMGNLPPGRLPGDREVSVASRSPGGPDAIDWRAALASAARSQRECKSVFWRPNRRAPNRIGEVPGRAHVPSRSKMLVGIDTSKSMPRSAFGVIAAELRKLSSLADMTIVECDASIQRVYPFKGELVSVRGRGGTDLRPLFARELLAEHAPDTVVYFTDGEGGFPREAPPVKTIWVLTQEGQFKCPWGDRVYLPLDEST